MDSGLREAPHVPRVQHSASTGLSPRFGIHTITAQSYLEGADGGGEAEEDRPSCRSELHDAADEIHPTGSEPLTDTKMRHRQTARQPRSPRSEIEEELNATTWRELGWHSSARETREELSTRSHPSRTVLPTVLPSLANRSARSANEPQQFASSDLSVRRRKHAPSGSCTAVFVREGPLWGSGKRK